MAPFDRARTVLVAKIPKQLAAVLDARHEDWANEMKPATTGPGNHHGFRPGNDLMPIKLPRPHIAQNMPTEYGGRWATRSLQPQQGRLQIVPMALTASKSAKNPLPQHLEVAPVTDKDTTVFRKHPKENRILQRGNLESVNLGRNLELQHWHETRVAGHPDGIRDSCVSVTSRSHPGTLASGNPGSSRGNSRTAGSKEPDLICASQAREDARLSALPICQRTPGPNSKTIPPGVISSQLGGSSSASRAVGFTSSSRSPES